MASRIESDSPSKALRRQAEQKATPPVSAKPPAPAAPPKQIPKRGPAVAEQPEQEQAEDQESRPAGRGLFGQIPAWGISMLVHILAILVMALMTGDPVRIEKPTEITSSVSEPEEEISELEEPEDIPEETPEDVTDPVADVMVTTEVAVSSVEVAAMPDDLEAAPLAVELSEFGSETALASDMMATIGAVGGSGTGMGGGFGARGKPGKVAGTRGGGADTEAAVDRALKWLAEHQLPDGGWDFNLANCPNCEGKCSHSGALNDRGGATALALLPFLGRGYTHREGPYTKQVEGGIRFLVGKAVAGKGSVSNPGGCFYSVGIAGIALSECYAMSQDPDLAAPTQTVLNFIMDAQDPARGGWRYYPKGGSDTSALSWFLMALKSGHMAYLQVRPEVIKKAGEFLDEIQLNEQGSAYGYDTIQNAANATPATSAIGLLSRMYLGWQKDHPGIQAGALVIAQRGPTDDLYYDYYATQFMHHLEGDMWIAWNAKMKALLLQTQARKGHEAGSWYDGVAGDEGHGPKTGGRLYCTAMATMILEVYYRHLPLYSTQSVQEKFRD